MTEIERFITIVFFNVTFTAAGSTLSLFSVILVLVLVRTWIYKTTRRQHVYPSATRTNLHVLGGQSLSCLRVSKKGQKRMGRLASG